MSDVVEDLLEELTERINAMESASKGVVQSSVGALPETLKKKM